MDKINIYTDGSSRGNPGNGGYGVVLIYKGHVKEFSEGFRKTTNNRMELLAVIVALESLKTNEIPIVLHSDSKYVLDSITKGWVFGWVKKGFKDKKNADLWRRFLKVYDKKFKIEFKWVKGHAGNPGNERCDLLATQAADGGNLKIDEVFEKEAGNSSESLF